jgi:regulator of sirC expression with transglutaminase-like and TPR domain
VQAESAVREKRLADAVRLYQSALKIVPWWPEGHFNRSLVLAELNRYGEAISEMKRYLALVPDAPNARAAQDKIYEWEGKLAPVQR